MKWRALLVLLVLGVLVSGAFGAETHRTAPINVTATLTFGHTRALGPIGRVGNFQQQIWRINDRYGRPIGRWLVTCRWMSGQERFCHTDMILPRGQIIASGSSPTQFEGEYAVIGGTGLYQGGGGVMEFTAIGLSKSVLLVVITT